MDGVVSDFLVAVTVPAGVCIQRANGVLRRVPGQQEVLKPLQTQAAHVAELADALDSGSSE